MKYGNVSYKILCSIAAVFVEKYWMHHGGEVTKNVNPPSTFDDLQVALLLNKQGGTMHFTTFKFKAKGPNRSDVNLNQKMKENAQKFLSNI